MPDHRPDPDALLAALHADEARARRATQWWFAGSALAGLSQNMAMLILFRGIQGIGAGALFPVALANLFLTALYVALSS